MDAESVYRQLGRLIETMPDFYSGKAWSADTHTWVGRADAIVTQGGDESDRIEWRTATSLLELQPHNAISLMIRILYRVLAAAELKAPAGAKGTFIPVGSSFDAFAALTKLLGVAARDILIVDPYMDETALTEFGGSVPPSIPLRLLSDQSSVKPSLASAAKAWVAQHGAARPLGVRLAPPKALHDRVILIDGKTAWTLTQSLKDFAKRAPAEIVRTDDTAALKISAYEAVWSTATVVI